LATQPITPIERVIALALKRHGCTAAQLAERVQMAPTNFSLARNSKRSFPLPALLNIFELAEISAEERIKVLEWVAFK
jgi:transcriptional regulator with XRE-family HTH domain